MTVFSSCQRVCFRPLTRRQRLMESLWKMKLSTALILINFLFPSGECATCSLPQAWNGEWFIDEFANGHPSTINSSTNFISRFATDVNQKLGNCIWQDRDFYVFQNVEANCSKCVLISEKHKNVLYSKEAYCQPDIERDPDDPSALCHALQESHDNEQYFWFRVDYKPITCPFVESTFQFSYRKGWGEKCEKPISHSSSCIENTKMEFQYEACHDNPNSVGKTELMTCVGGWGDFGHDYLVADVTRMNNHGERSLRDRYRCFTYQKNTMMSSTPGKLPFVTGYDVGTSDLATCIGLHSPDEAETTLYFKKDLSIDTEEEKPCKFPSWFGEHHWMDMSKSVEFQLSPQTKNRSIHVQPTRHYHDTPKVDLSSSKRKSFFPLSHSNLVCLDKMNLTDSDEQVAIVAKYAVGCKVDMICLHIIKRSEYIFQMYYLEETDMAKTTLRERCFNATFSELRRGATMISTHGVREGCQNSGRYLPTPLESQPFKMNSNKFAASDGEWMIGCNNAHDVTLLQSPSPHNVELKHFSCMDSWNEGNTSFTIMSSANDHHHQHFDKLHCIVSDINRDPVSGSRQTLVITSQDCLQFSETNTLTNSEDDAYINLSNSDGTYIDGIELYKTGHCNSTSTEEEATNESAMTPKIDHLLDSQTHSGSGSYAVKTMKFKPVYFVTMFMTMTVLILNVEL